MHVLRLFIKDIISLSIKNLNMYKSKSNRSRIYTQCLYMSAERQRHLATESCLYFCRPRVKLQIGFYKTISLPPSLYPSLPLANNMTCLMSRCWTFGIVQLPLPLPASPRPLILFHDCFPLSQDPSTMLPKCHLYGKLLYKDSLEPFICCGQDINLCLGETA